MLQALVLCQSELSRGLCVVYVQKDDAVLSLGSWLRGIYKAVCGLSLHLDSFIYKSSEKWIFQIDALTIFPCLVPIIMLFNNI